MRSNYTNYIVIGSSSITNQCAIHLKKIGLNIILLEPFSKNNSLCKSFAYNNSIDYVGIENKDDITRYFECIKGDTLVISASNRYIFPEKVISKANFDIINYHSALLPKYPGRNAEAWAIYYGESLGGITWHIVSTEIDAGNIIIQKSIKIDGNTTSLSLLKSYNRIAYEAFIELIERIFQNKVELTKQDLIEKPKLFLSKMRPNNGILEVGFDENIFSQFLRSYDYGLFKVLGDYHLQLENGRLIRAYDYNIHSILNFSPKFKNRIVIEKQNLIFEIKL